jgi:menaquinone-dependent protoporphyrinogen oxidase
MTARVLVAYASKHGATTEIAKKMGEILNEAGLKATVLPAEQVVDLTPFDAVVLGSAVYAGSWRKEAVHFLEKFESLLAKMPVWFFSSGPTGEGDPTTLLKDWRCPTAQEPLANRIRPRDIAVFQGELDMEKLNFAEKLIIKGVKAPVGDFRNWDSITDWAASIVDVLQTEVIQS